MKLKLLSAFVLAVCAAKASVTINFNIDTVYNLNGVAVPTTGLGLLIADTTGDGFGSLNVGSLAAGSLVGSSDLVVYRADFSTFGTEGVWSEAASNLTLSGAWNGNDQLAFVWFPTLTIGDTSVGAGVNYGLLTSSTWLTPSDGGSNADTYQAITATNNGFFGTTPATLQLTDAQGRATLFTPSVPEPSTYAAVAGILVLGAAALRKRRSV